MTMRLTSAASATPRNESVSITLGSAPAAWSLAELLSRRCAEGGDCSAHHNWGDFIGRDGISKKM
jgi:hypothetical protein